MDTIPASFHKGFKATYAHRYDKPEHIDTYQSKLGKIQTEKKGEDSVFILSENKTSVRL